MYDFIIRKMIGVYRQIIEQHIPDVLVKILL